MHIHYYDKNPFPAGHDFYSYSKNFLSHHYYILSLMNNALELRRICVKNTYTCILRFTPKNYFWFFSLYPTDATYEICQAVLEKKKMFTHDARRRKQTHSNR